MRLFNYTFEESQSFVNEDIINKVKTKGSYKRFIGFALFSILLYILSLVVPVLLSGDTIYTTQNFSWFNVPLILMFLMFYIIYIIFSIKYRKNPMILKYITFCYMLLLIFIMEICLTLSIASRRNLLGILSGFLFVIVCYYLMRTVPRKIRESVEKKEPFVPLSALFTEKVSDGLIFIGGTGITAFLALFDRSTGSDTRGAINAIVTPFVPAILLFAVYVFSIDLLRGYYLFKYSEQYRKQFGYSVKDWYGEKSKEYKKSQNSMTE